MAALLSTPRRRRKERSCHFCSATKQADCDCGGWARTDEDGNLIDYLPQMSDQNLNSKPPLAVSLPRTTLTVSPKLGKKTSAGSQSPIYCSTCLANQNLQINLLANYLPADRESGTSTPPSHLTALTNTLIENLPAYKASLEARYPVLCPECTPKVSEIIKQRNYQAKAFLLNESAKRLAKPLKSSLNSPRPANDIASLPIFGMGGKIWTIQEWLWRVQGLVWILSYTLSISVTLHSSFSFQCPSGALLNPRPSISSYLANPGFIPIFCCCCIEVSCSLFDFTWSRVRKNRAQGMKTKVIGKGMFMCLNTIACFLRIFVWVYFFSDHPAISHRNFNEFICTLSPSFGSVMFGLIGTVLLALLMGSLNVLKTDSPIGVKSLATSHKATSLNLAIPKPTSALSEEELFSTLSLARPALTSDRQRTPSYSSLTTGGTASSLPVEHTFGKSTALQASYQNLGSPSRSALISNQPTEDPMIWEPSPCPNQQSDHPLLKPQTFLPPPALREETGIEDLFAQKATLVARQDDPNKPSSWLQRLFYVE